MDFEFPESAQVERFFLRFPRFGPGFDLIQDVSNKILGRRNAHTNRAEYVCFGLAHTCREDYLEIVFLASSGFGDGALRTLRGLYERAVTLAYIAKYPEKAERFSKYQAILNRRAMDDVLRVSSEAQFEAIAGEGAFAQYRKAYEEVKAEFARREMSWNGPLKNMVKDVGNPYDSYYPGSYVMPNFLIHTNLTSVFDGTAKAVRDERSIRNADLALLNGTACFISVLREQNKQFHLGLEADLEVCESDLHGLFAANQI